jgi:hypothetical protein
MANFKEKLEQFIENAKPKWHIAYYYSNFKICGLWPKDPRVEYPNDLIPLSRVIPLPEDQWNLVDEMFAQGILKYRVNQQTLRVEPVPVETEEGGHDGLGDFARIEFNNSIDESIIDARISILLEQKVFKVKLITDTAKDYIKSMIINPEEEVRIRFYITKYNNPNELLNPIVVSANKLAENGETEVEFDGSTLPEDISIYYIKIFNKANFEVK